MRTLHSVATSLVIAGSASLLAAQAMAADYLPPPPPPAPYIAPLASTWTGLYLGGTIGWGEGNVDGLFDSSELPDTEFVTFFNQLDPDGLTGGIHLGYNWQVHDSLVVGIEGDWMFMDWNDQAFDLAPDFPGTDNATVDISSLGSLRGRVGVTNGDTLFFATAGVAWVDADLTVCDCDDLPIESPTVDLGDTGFVVGGGIEHKIHGGPWSARVEGLYYGFDNTVNTATLTDDSDVGDFASLDDIVVVRAGISYHFPPH